MNYLLTLFLLVLFTGSAWAEVGSLKDCTKNGVSIDCKSILVPLPDEIQQAGGNPCLATMEATLHNIEPYLPLPVSIEVQEWVQRVLAQKTTKNNAALAKEGEERANRYALIGEIFHATKRECWRHP